VSAAAGRVNLVVHLLRHQKCSTAWNRFVIELFADLTGDRNPLHSKATSPPIPRSGASLCRGVTSGLLNAVVAEDRAGPCGVIPELNRRFHHPVRRGDTITAEVEVITTRHESHPSLRPVRRARQSPEASLQESRTWTFSLTLSAEDLLGLFGLQRPHRRLDGERSHGSMKSKSGIRCMSKERKLRFERGDIVVVVVCDPDRTAVVFGGFLTETPRCAADRSSPTGGRRGWHSKTGRADTRGARPGRPGANPIGRRGGRRRRSRVAGVRRRIRCGDGRRRHGGLPRRRLADPVGHRRPKPGGGARSSIWRRTDDRATDAVTRPPPTAVPTRRQGLRHLAAPSASVWSVRPVPASRRRVRALETSDPSSPATRPARSTTASPGTSSEGGGQVDLTACCGKPTDLFD
jgi:MaoC like domain